MQTLILQVQVAEILGFQPVPRCCRSRDHTCRNKTTLVETRDQLVLNSQNAGSTGNLFWFNDMFLALRREQRRVIKYKHGDPASQGLRKPDFDCGPAPAAGILLGKLWAPHIHQAG